LKNIEAAAMLGLGFRYYGHEYGIIPAVEVKQNAKPARHDVAIVVSPPAMGRDNKMPMAGGERY
jgi:hypothetical protein